MAPGEPARRIRIWDLPTRFFHWLLVLLIPFQYWTAEENRIDLHIVGGTLIVGLLAFRILWGLFGSSTARFTNFIRGPASVVKYVRGNVGDLVGHSPIGALSVVALLAMLCAQTGLGLFAGDEDGIESGPLSHLIDGDLSEDLARLHKDGFDILLVLIGLHIAAIVFYALFRRKNLVGPMISGRGRAPESAGDQASEMEGAPVWRFLLAALAAAAFAYWVNKGAPL